MSLMGSIKEKLGMGTKEPSPAPAPAPKIEAPEKEEPKNLFNAGEKPLVRPFSAGAVAPDMVALDKAVKGMDFTKGIDPKLAEAALKGDMSALSMMINQAAQNAYKESTLAGNQIQEAAFQNRVSGIDSMIEEKIKGKTISDTLSNKNQAFKDEGISPLLKMITDNARSQYPEATPEELANHAEKFLTSVASKIVDGSPEAQAAATQREKTAEKQTNWQDYFASNQE
jgi:hypothetical protein